MERVKDASREIFLLALTLDPKSPHHPNKLRQMGAMWQEARLASGLNIGEAAQRSGVLEDNIILFESGLLDPYYRAGMLEDLSEGYSHPELLEVHESLFGPVKKREGRHNLLTVEFDPWIDTTLDPTSWV